MRSAVTVARYAIQESIRRRVFVVVLVLSVGFLALYAWGSSAAFDEVNRNLDFDDSPVRAVALAGGILLGMAMFSTLFLGAVLAVFLTLNAVRGDAERGLLQAIVVRPVPRSAVLLGRFLAALAVCGTYVVVMFLASAAITRWAGDWTPDRWFSPVAGLLGAVAVLIAIALVGSVFLSGTASGIAVFMVFGAGLVGGLLGQIGRAIESRSLERASEWITWGLPFEALYQNGLYGLTADFAGLDRLVINLGPFGGAREYGIGIWFWSIAFILIVGAIATWAFRRRDL
jgi:ABC-type transport system involved in multi-copper enzyme maturation permease subunit